MRELYSCFENFIGASCPSVRLARLVDHLSPITSRRSPLILSAMCGNREITSLFLTSPHTSGLLAAVDQASQAIIRNFYFLLLNIDICTYYRGT